MSYSERINRIKKLKKWNCKLDHDLIASFKILPKNFINFKRYIKEFISSAMQINYYENDDIFINEVDKSRNLKNITPNGAVVPKREYLLEYNLILREWKDIMSKIVSQKPEMLNRFRFTPNIRIKFSKEINKNKNRDLNTSFPHSDAWLEGPWGMNCFIPLFGDTKNNTLKYYEPNKKSFSEKFMRTSSSYKDMQWVLKYYKPINFIPKAGRVYFSDYAMVHNTEKKKNAGTRISIDTTLYIGSNPPHKDRISEYEKKFLDIGISHIIDPGRYEREKILRKKSTFSHYTTGVRRNIKLF